MCTGIITDVGCVVAVERRGDTLFTIGTQFDMDTVALGASIACSGCCLTVIDKAPGRFTVSASAETLSKTTLGSWTEGTEVNLERALCLGDELGGHIVSGHVDGVAEVISAAPEGDSWRYVFQVPDAFAKFMAPKGSVALDGVSLTVNEVEGSRFGVNIIPHTRQCTTFRVLSPGDRMNFEVDMLARYVARIMASD
jgi:riboflavin synthase